MKIYNKYKPFFVFCLALLLTIGVIGIVQHSNPDTSVKKVPAVGDSSDLTVALKSLNTVRLERSVVVYGVERTYIVHIPKEGQDTKSHPVLFAFHPAGATATFMEENAPFYTNPKASQFVVVYPQGYARTYNVGDCCAGAMKKGVDDVAFFEAIMEDLKTLLLIQEKAYLTGFSNGSFMTFRLICDVPERIAAAAPYAGAIAMDSCVTGTTVPVMYLNGSEDSTTLFADKTNKSSRFSNAMNVLVLPSVALDAVALRNGCGSDITEIEGIEAWDATCTQYKNCPLDAQVSMCVIPDLGHAWPGSGDLEASGAEPLALNAEDLGPFRPNLDNTGPILDFFLIHENLHAIE